MFSAPQEKTFFGHFSTFLDILSTFPSSGLSNDLPVMVSLEKKENSFVPVIFWPIKFQAGPGIGTRISPPCSNIRDTAMRQLNLAYGRHVHDAKFGIGPPPPAQAVPRARNRGRVRKESRKSTRGGTPRVSKECAPSLDRVRQESNKTHFRTLLRLRPGRALSCLWGSRPGGLFRDSFRTLLRFRARMGPGDPVRGGADPNAKLLAMSVFHVGATVFEGILTATNHVNKYQNGKAGSKCQDKFLNFRRATNIKNLQEWCAPSDAILSDRQFVPGPIWGALT